MLSKVNLLFLVIILAFFLRLYDLPNVPPSASLDEASIGFNAYSILETGRDEYDTKFPILLRAYDDWRPALYVYLVIPFVKFFGLNVLSVRLPSIILSIFTIIATYFLVKEFFLKDKNKIFIAQLSSSLLAISPWHIYISRLGHEVNAGLSFIIFAILFFLKAINGKNKLFLVLSSIFFALSLYTYQSEKVFTPLIVLILVLIYRKSLLKIKKELLISLVVGIIVIIPIMLVTFSPEGLIRFKGTSAFSQESFYKKSADEILRFRNEGNIFGEIISNRRLVPLKIFAANYFSHFNPEFIFFNSGNESFKAPNFGLMYIWEFPFLILGIIFLLKQAHIKVKLFLGSWLLIAFIAPSLTTGAPHAMRAFNVLPIPQILIALAILRVIKSRIRSLGITVVIIYFLVNFYHEYFYSFPKNQSSSFQYSLHSAIRFVLSNERRYDTIIFSNKDNLYQSYMFFLFDSKYDPYLYQKQGGTKSGGFEEPHKFGKYEFRPVAWNKGKFAQNTLFIGNAQDFPSSVNVLASFANLNGKGVIKVAQN